MAKIAEKLKNAVIRNEAKTLDFKLFTADFKGFYFCLVPKAGVEPARYRYRRILSPVRLPIPPFRHKIPPYNNTESCENQVKIYDSEIERFL